MHATSHVRILLDGTAMNSRAPLQHAGQLQEAPLIQLSARIVGPLCTLLLLAEFVLGILLQSCSPMPATIGILAFHWTLFAKTAHNVSSKTQQFEQEVTSVSKALEVASQTHSVESSGSIVAMLKSSMIVG